MSEPYVPHDDGSFDLVFNDVTYKCPAISAKDYWALREKSAAISEKLKEASDSLASNNSLALDKEIYEMAEDWYSTLLTCLCPGQEPPTDFPMWIINPAYIGEIQSHWIMRPLGQSGE